MTGTVLVTGGRGRVGRRLVEALRDRGYRVRAVDRAPCEGVPDDVVVDLEDREATAAAVAGVGTVVHLAAFMSWDVKDAAAVFSANVDATFNVFEAVRAGGTARVVLASSGEVYPESKPRYLPIDEQHPTEPTSHYGMSKLLAEDMAWFYARRYGVTVTVLRFPHTQDAAELLDIDSPMSGPRFFLRRKLAQARSFGNHEAVKALQPYDDGSDRLLLSRSADGVPYQMPICDTRDTVAGIVLALTNPAAEGQTIALGPPTNARFDEAVPRMSALSDLDYVDICLPGPPVNYGVDLTKARRVLGFEPVYDFDKMLDEAAEAFRRRQQHRSS